MKKTLIVLGCMSLGLAHAQQNGRDHAQHQTPDTRVGINTEKPVATLELKKVEGLPATQVQGFLLPHLTKEERDAMEKEALVNGLMIFNTTKNCIDWWDGSKWACTDGSKVDRPTPAMPATTPIALPNGITIDNSRKMIASIYDTDYLPYSTPTSVANWNNVTNIAADGQADETIDVKGKVTTAGLAVQIPVKATTSGSIPEYKTYVHVPAERTQDGVERILELSWAAQTFSGATTVINATIKSLDGDLNIKQLDIIGGMGSDYKGLELATFAIPQSIADGNTPATYRGQFELRAVSGIPDKNFNKVVEGQKRHQFLYLPVQGPDGRLWLNNNLGADYANMNSPHFDPAQQAKTFDDYKAYGSLFQFGREADGHELMKYTSASDGTPVFTQPPYTWSYSVETALTQYTDNCPEGWHLPTETEFKSLIVSVLPDYPTNRTMHDYLLGTMRISHVLQRSWTDGLQVGRSGRINPIYWSATESSPTRAILTMIGDNTQQYDYPKTMGFAVRCIKD